MGNVGFAAHPDSPPACPSGIPMQPVRDKATNVPFRRLVGLTLLAWLASVEFDFLLHGGLLAHLYVEPSQFLLPPKDAFRLIPLGYLSFLLLTILLVWLANAMHVKGYKRGLLFGLKLGGSIWGALVLGLASITTAGYGLLAGWFVGQTLEMGLAGAVVGSGLVGTHAKKLLGIVLLIGVVCAVVAVVLQSTGLAPSVQM